MHVFSSTQTKSLNFALPSLNPIIKRKGVKVQHLADRWWNFRGRNDRF
jgi:hypothetical protein